MRPLTRIGPLLALVCGLPGMVPAPALAEEGPRTLLAVFAHPDDEEVVMPLLARYAREGVDVHLAIATDGQKGVTPHAGIPAGEELAAVRAEEARCACETLGIHPPILLGLVDGELYKEENQATLLREITRLFDELKPDVVLTWGPDGVTGHNDHRLVSSLVTQVFQTTATPAQLYYPGIPTERLAALAQAAGPGGRPRGPRAEGDDGASAAQGGERRRRRGRGGPGGAMGFATVSESFLPVRIAYEEEDGDKATQAIGCHKSQYSPEQIAQRAPMIRALRDGTVLLRPWTVETAPITELFE